MAQGPGMWPGVASQSHRLPGTVTSSVVKHMTWTGPIRIYLLGYNYWGSFSPSPELARQVRWKPRELVLLPHGKNFPKNETSTKSKQGLETKRNNILDPLPLECMYPIYPWSFQLYQLKKKKKTFKFLFAYTSWALEMKNVLHKL